MKIPVANDFHAQVAFDAAAIYPDIEWALTDRAGGWTAPPEGSDIVVYAAETYTDAFVDTVIGIAPPRWAHTEDAGIDGRFYDDMRAEGVAVTHSPGANAPEFAEFTFAGVMWGGSASASSATSSAPMTGASSRRPGTVRDKHLRGTGGLAGVER